jgi:hypothetical protein
MVSIAQYLCGTGSPSITAGVEARGSSVSLLTVMKWGSTSGQAFLKIPGHGLAVADSVALATGTSKSLPLKCVRI